jgi:ankyrin repeat protein
VTPPACWQVPLLDLLQLLVEAGADPTAQDALGRTPLQVAIASGNTPCVGFLALREWHVNLAVHLQILS